MSIPILVAGLKANITYYHPYLDAIESAGGEPVLDWPGPEIRNDDTVMGTFMARFRGAVLPGGIDIDPRLYGEERCSEVGRTDDELDAGHLAVARFLLGGRCPGLGICRGLQILALAAGGRLCQDLLTQYPVRPDYAALIQHKNPGPHDALIHDVGLCEGIRLARICGTNSFKVNSRHHQAVQVEEEGESIGPFAVAGRAPDGVVEALEHPLHPFLLAVQWHPEDLVETHEPSRRLFQALVDACRESRR
jgi:putative glutamine amidotransferase